MPKRTLPESAGPKEESAGRVEKPMDAFRRLARKVINITREEALEAEREERKKQTERD